MKNKIIRIAAAALLLAAFTACSAAPAGSAASAAPSSSAAAVKAVKIGVCPGPYGDMVEQAIAPYLEQHGYSVQVVNFTDYVQPDQALAGGEIDANLMQHTAYLTQFSKDNKLDLAKVIAVPTAGMGVFSSSIASLDAIPEGAKVALPTDAVNLARSLKLLKTLGVIDIKDGVDDTKAAVSDVSSNPKNLQFIPMDAAQIARSLDSVGIGMVPGNYAIAAKLDFSKALAVEKLTEDYKNVVAVRSGDLDGQLGKDLKAAVESEDFHQAIENPDGIFKAFDKPEWYAQKYGE